MATVVKTVSAYNQEGVANSSVPQLYDAYPGGNHGVEVNRSFLTRYSETDVPKGSVVSNATISYTIGVKTNGNAQNFGWTLYYQPGTTSNPLIKGIQEDTARTWTQITTGVHTWVPNSPNGLMTMSVNITSAMQTIVNQAGWDSKAPLCFRLMITSESGDLNIRGENERYPHTLTVTFTPAEEAPRIRLNEYENGNFTAPGTQNYFGHMTAFGEFPNAPTITVGSPMDGLSAPYGGNVVKITSNGGKVMSFFPNLWLRKLEGWWTLSCNVFVPAGQPDIKLDWIYISGGEWQTTKGQWFEVHHSFMFYSEQRAPQLGIASRADMPAGTAFYIANLRLYEGKAISSYSDGNTADYSVATNIAHDMPIDVLGSSTVSKIEYNGEGWTRVQPTVANNGARINVPLASLTNGQSYTASVEVAVPAGSPTANIAIDWADTSAETDNVAPGTSKRIYVTGTKATYDSTFRFIDVVAQAGANFYIRRVMLTAGPTQHPYFGEKLGRNFMWGGGATSGTPYVSVLPPNVVVTPPPTVSAKNNFNLGWDFQPYYTTGQSRVRIEFRSDE